MALAMCTTLVDNSGRELTQHGPTDFPIACYHDDLSLGEVPWHWHDELEAVVIEKGYATVSAGNQTYTVGPGEGFFVNAGILHGAWDVDDSGCRFHSVVFHPRLVGGSLDSVYYQSYVLPVIQNTGIDNMKLHPEISWQKNALDRIETAWQSGVNEPEGYEFIVREALSQLIFLLQRNMPATQTLPGAKAVRDSQRIKTMLRYVHENYVDEISTQSIASSAMISESECLRCFRATIGTTPIRYVRQYRIQRATQLLANTEEQISDIAIRCGFQDVSYFTKTFREAKGCTPSQYRSKIR